MVAQITRSLARPAGVAGEHRRRVLPQAARGLRLPVDASPSDWILCVREMKHRWLGKVDRWKGRVDG